MDEILSKIKAQLLIKYPRKLLSTNEKEPFLSININITHTPTLHNIPKLLLILPFLSLELANENFHKLAQKFPKASQSQIKYLLVPTLSFTKAVY